MGSAVNNKFPHWCEFGVHPSGNVDISDGTNDVGTDIPKDSALTLVREHNRVAFAFEKFYFLVHGGMSAPDALSKLLWGDDGSSSS